MQNENPFVKLNESISEKNTTLSRREEIAAMVATHVKSMSILGNIKCAKGDELLQMSFDFADEFLAFANKIRRA